MASRSLLTALAQTAGLKDSGRQQIKALLAELAYLEEAAQLEGSLLAGETAKLLIFVWLVLHRCGELTAAADPAAAGSDLISSFGLARPLEEELSGEATAAGDQLARLDVPAVMALFAVLLRWQRFMAFAEPAQAELLPGLLADRDVAALPRTAQQRRFSVVYQGAVGTAAGAGWSLYHWRQLPVTDLCGKMPEL